MVEPKSKPKIQVPNNMGRSSSSNSELSHLDSPHSPLRFHSPLRSDHGDPPETPPYASPINSPEKPPPVIDNSKAIVAVDKFTQYSPVTSQLPTENAAVKSASAQETENRPPTVMMNRAMRQESAKNVRTVGEERRPGTVASILRRSRREEMVRIGELGFRLSEVVLCLISFSVMAADKTQGWSGDSFDRYKEYRYCLSVNVIGFVYSGFQAYDLGYHLVTGKHVIRHHLRRHFNFCLDQILAYLLISASSSAATRADDWQSNWGKDRFTEMATASVAMAFLAFLAFAVSSLISGYNLCGST
ncbi:hypothetical protein K2173_022779 [Erythroxylum novogranatense]|uniref:CASP-like protein n=1 Tax=Erythroxylum novogranatense TaxID=1862640 RepID=A0AAV8SMW2_9ROSI|nr:hypothetical protein K2173_022779 [Erythroxylum novogranatense]